MGKKPFAGRIITYPATLPLSERELILAFSGEATKKNAGARPA
jgi:hypothetical protein